MSDDWETVTHIGQSRSGTGGGGLQSHVIKNNASLNAARRSGLLTTEKKFTSANSKSDPEAQFLTKVANSTEIVKPLSQDTVTKAAIRTAMLAARKAKNNMTQDQLAGHCNTSPAVIKDFESGTERPSQKIISSIERQLGIFVTGDINKIGQAKVFVSAKDKKEAEEKKGKGKGKAEK